MKFLMQAMCMTALSPFLLTGCEKPPETAHQEYMTRVEAVLLRAVRADYARDKCGRTITPCDLVPTGDCAPKDGTEYIYADQACQADYQLQAAQVVYNGLEHCWTHAAHVDETAAVEDYRAIQKILIENKIQVTINGDDDDDLRDTTIEKNRSFNQQVPQMCRQMQASGETRLNIALVN